MSAYLIAQLTVTDPEGFGRYRDAVTERVARYGGRYLVRGGATDCLEGDWAASRMVIIAFDSVEQAKRFYDSPEYREILPLRRDNSEGVVVLAEGYADPAPPVTGR